MIKRYKGEIPEGFEGGEGGGIVKRYKPSGGLADEKVKKLVEDVMHILGY